MAGSVHARSLPQELARSLTFGYDASPMDAPNAVSTLPDPNWLLSTAAQAAAAIVAIVGGFLVSRVLGLSAERTRLEAALREVRASLAFKTHEAHRVDIRIVESDANDFIDDITEYLVESRGLGTLGEAMRKADRRGLTEDQLSPFYAKAVQRTQGDVPMAVEFAD
jgi:hypothetical protein